MYPSIHLQSAAIEEGQSHSAEQGLFGPSPLKQSGEEVQTDFGMEFNSWNEIDIFWK